VRKMKISTCLFLALFIAPLLVAQTQFSTDLLALNPLGFWPLNGNANDASAHGNNGAVVRGVTFANSVGPLGISAAPAAAFESSRSALISVQGPGASIFNLGALHPLTAMAWIRTVSQGRDDLVIMGKFDPAAETGWGIFIDGGDFGGPQNPGHLAMGFFASGQPLLAVLSAPAVNDGGWHLIAVTYDGGGKASGVRMYVDGVSVGTTAVVDSIGGGSILNGAPLTIGGITDGSDSFEGNLNDAAVFGVALTPEQILHLALDAPGYKRILPQFAFGGGWYSAIYFVNTARGRAISFPVSFTGDDGNPLNVPSISASSTTVNLAPGGVAVIEAPNVGPLVQGYVSVVLPVGVAGYGVFRSSGPGVPDQEAVVPLSPASAQTQALLYDETSLVTAAAIVNPSPVATTVDITVTDTGGNVVGTSSVILPPFCKTASVLRSLPGLSQIVGTRGTAVFHVSSPTNFTGSVSVLGLRFNGTAFTSIPATGTAGF
jgi:hypothetical protein